MNDVTVRRMPTEEMLEVMHPLATYAFRPSPPLYDKEEWQDLVRQREDVTYLALFEDGAGVATAASAKMTQRVRGALYDVGGVWGVATRPDARRKGYCRRLMGDALVAMREQGQPLSCLYPFRESFYERLGYVAFPLTRTVRLKPSALLPLLDRDLGGEIELVPIRDAYDLYRDYVHRLQQRVHGMAVFVHGQKAQAQKQNHFWVAQAKVDGELAGLMLYDLKGNDVTQFTLRAVRFYYDTIQARYLLLQWLARHVDQASQIELLLPPYEQPELWLADLRIEIEAAVRPAMARVVDVAAIGGMEVGAGSFAARLSDPLCPWNEGVWRLASDGGTLQVGPAGAPDCDLSIQGLTALVYGTHDPAGFSVRDWGNPTPQVQAVMRALFPPMVPHMHEVF